MLRQHEHVGLVGRVREKNWTLPTRSRRWPAQLRGRLKAAAAGRAASAGAPHRSRDRHMQAVWRSCSGGRVWAPAARPRHGKGSKRQQQRPPYAEASVS